jgi:hypothetical protein
MTQTPSIIVTDNFYSNPMEVREFALKQDFYVTGGSKFPGYRTQSYATDEVKDLIQSYIEPYGMEIDTWNNKPDDYNGTFHYTTAENRSWIHMDNNEREYMAGVLYLTPNAPFSAGTGFFRPKINEETEPLPDIPLSHGYLVRPGWPPGFCPRRGFRVGAWPDGRFYCMDMTKWELVDRIGNVFNRLVIYNSNIWHTGMDLFGDCKENGRLSQTFFFKPKKKG